MTAFPTASLRNCPPDTQKKFLRCKTRHGSVIDVLTEIQAHNNSTTPCHPIEKRKGKKIHNALNQKKKKKQRQSISVCLISMTYQSLGQHTVIVIGFSFFLFNDD
jgi:hypothetical protein